MQSVSRRLHEARELLAAAEQTAALQRSMRQHDYALNWEAAQALLDSGPNRPAWSALQGGAEHLLEQLRDSTTSAARLHDTPSAAGRQPQHTRPAHRAPSTPPTPIMSRHTSRSARSSTSRRGSVARDAPLT